MQTSIKEKEDILLENSWKEILWDEFNKPYMKDLKNFLIEEKKQKKIIYPKGGDIFQSFNLTPFDSVRVVIIGQDPYHGENQAHGLCFSVKEGVAPPPSLLNIYKELASDLNIIKTKSGNLEAWAKQGVLLLNAVLTVEKNRAASHQKKGWEKFTDRVIEELNARREHLVFILWGSYAQAKGAHIDRNKHYVIESPHPSPLSAHRGFLGSKPFSKTNQYLVAHGEVPITW